MERVFATFALSLYLDDIIYYRFCHNICLPLEGMQFTFVPFFLSWEVFPSIPVLLLRLLTLKR